ncbi:zinc ribbon-containing protein [Ferrovum myxofaciens]|uniref:Zinc ribbon-containing protein n=1 Tax=Ferrovum myxofaciens TaxID=416213 RepID=A0A9E6MXC8_9PROT|nr:zinc ribbon-containing protein [Ferrovum myxofaciens]QKE39499.1 MAG: zinc ribbon-containing protein [Ferrovum myxofaciens]QWY74776.1 MAG: zinc ribbon-containing protein [Ferrovum myxofaciens]QWY77524.1 MAG: zinc ribbon-containing protein [Ferrovum myxofaciens]
MKALTPSHDPVETLDKAYEVLLERALWKAHKSGVALHHTIGEIRDDTLPLIKLNEEDVVKLESYVKRDLIDAARYRDKTGKALQDWLGFELALITHEFWEIFSAAADKTTTELSLLKLQAEIAEYHTGELTGLGTLVCDQCAEKLHFHKPGHIPPCPKCSSTHFHRQNFE